MVGSHLDTQPTGGKYDGVLGVLGGLEVIRTLNDLGIRTKHPIEVVNWTNEEGTRFAPAMLASGVFAGVYTRTTPTSRTDAEGKEFGEELERIGFIGDEPVGRRPLQRLSSRYHIEQGPILEAEGEQIGVVTHGQGLCWLRGDADRLRERMPARRPMPMRVNAGLGAARHRAGWCNDIALAPRAASPSARSAHMEVYPELAQRHSGHGGVHRRFPPPDERRCRRDGGGVQRVEARRSADEAASSACEVEGGRLLSTRWNSIEDCVDGRARAAERLGYSHRDIVSGAGHDACWIEPRRADRRWSCAPASTASATTRTRTSTGMGDGRRGRAVPRGGGDGGDRGVRSANRACALAGDASLHAADVRCLRCSGGDCVALENASRASSTILLATCGEAGTLTASSSTELR